MIDVIIASYKEPKATLRATRIFLKQIGKKDRIIVVDPFPEVGKFLKKQIKDKRFKFFLDPGEGKSYALNLLFQKYNTANKDNIFILSDGDVYVSDKAVDEIKKKFENPGIGCVTGRPVPVDSRNNKYGFWALVAFSGIDKVRRKLALKGKFFECSGYLFAIRKGVITDFPLGTSEDSIIPYLFWKKGFKIDYAGKAEVYVKNPKNLRDYLAQKVRNIKAHENLNKIAPEMPRTKSLLNEIKEGALFALTQFNSLREFIWLLQLYFARLYIYAKAFLELRKRQRYMDGWRGSALTETMKTLD